MSPFAEIRLVAQREVGKTTRSLKGALLLVITLLGAFVASLVCVYAEANKRAALGAASNDAFIEARRAVIEKATGDGALASRLATVPLSLNIFLTITIWLSPLLVALLGFDLVSADLQHRSIRFWTVRARRSSFYTGKLAGLFAQVLLITLVINVIADTVAVARGYVNATQLVTWGVRFWLTSLPIALVWAAIATFISSRFKTPILALLTTFGVFFVLWVVGIWGLISRLSDMVAGNPGATIRWYEYVYPNAYDTLLLSFEPVDVVKGLGILLAAAAAITAGGALLFARRDV